MPSRFLFNPELTALLNETLASSPAVIYRLDAEPPFALQYLSPNVAEALHIEFSGINSMADWMTMQHPEDRQFNYALFKDFAADTNQHQLTRRYRLRSHTDEYVWVEDSTKKIERAGLVVALAGAITNVHQQQLQAQEAAQSRRLLSEAQRIARIGHWVSYPQQNRLEWSANIYEMFGLDQQSFQPTISGFMAMIHEADRDLEQQALKHAEETGEYDVEHRVCCPNGRIIWVHERGEIKRQPDGSEQIIGTVRDITEAKEMQQELLQLARTDALTGVYNHRYFMETLQQELTRYQRHGRVFSVVMYDLDYFKQLNDTYGHSFGDDVLVGCAAAMQQRLRDVDTLARLGGEEFAILLPETDLAAATTVATQLQDCVHRLQLCPPQQIEPVAVTASFGVVQIAAKDVTRDEILQAVDQLMYRAKRQGRDQMVCDLLD